MPPPPIKPRPFARLPHCVDRRADKSGVYTKTAGSAVIGGHCVRLLGWGEDASKPYCAATVYRHHFGPVCHVPLALCPLHPPGGCALSTQYLGDHDRRMLIAAWNPMLRPNWGFRAGSQRVVEGLGRGRVLPHQPRARRRRRLPVLDLRGRGWPPPSAVVGTSPGTPKPRPLLCGLRQSHNT